MTKTTLPSGAIVFGMLLTLANASLSPVAGQSTILVAAKNSAPSSIEQADFRCSGVDDQDVIRQAILKLPEAGGTVVLMEGTYDIRKVPGALGGIVIERSHVTLAGQGASTLLRLAANQNTNVIRILGSGVGNITIRDLMVDANRAENSAGTGDPNVSHSRFEYCGIKAFRQDPHGASAADDCHDITVRHCWVRNAHRLGIMLEGSNMRVLDNFLGDAGSDVVEILTGPGMIRGNTVDILGRTHVALGTDRADNVIMDANVVRVHQGGHLDIAFRTWANSVQHVVSNNVFVLDPGGQCPIIMDLRGTRTSVTGNVVRATEGSQIKVSGGYTCLTGNTLEKVQVVVEDSVETDEPVQIGLNNLIDSSVEIKSRDVGP